MTSFPEERDEDPIVFWKSGLDVMKGHLKEVTTLLEDCKLLVEQIGEVEQDADVADVAAFAGAGQDADQMELGALREGVTQCFAALYDAVQAWMTAFATLSNRRSSGSSRARQYRRQQLNSAKSLATARDSRGNLAGEADLTVDAIVIDDPHRKLDKSNLVSDTGGRGACPEVVRGVPCYSGPG